MGIEDYTAKCLEDYDRVTNLAADINYPQTHAVPDITLPEIRNYHLADYQYEVLIERIKEFEEDLDDDHEIAVKLASFGQSITLSVTDIGYSNPSIIVFHGYVEGKRATLIQHVSQLSFLLVSVPKAEPDKPARRIGFDLSSHKNER